MLRQCLNYLLILLIAMQSVAAIADTHQNHVDADASGHQQYDHSHADGIDGAEGVKRSTDKQTPSSDNSPTGLDPLDCQHCCQCHSSSNSFMSAPNNFLAIGPTKSSAFSLNNHYQTPTLSPFLRPPVA